jgi:hypothetical protein
LESGEIQAEDQVAPARKGGPDRRWQRNQLDQGYGCDCGHSADRKTVVLPHAGLDNALGSKDKKRQGGQLHQCQAPRVTLAAAEGKRKGQKNNRS